MNPGYYGADHNDQIPSRNWATLRWTSGASGAIGSFSDTLKAGFAATPAAHGATGVYVISLEDAWADLVDWNIQIKQASYSKNGACYGRVTAWDLAAKTVTILIVDGDGDAVESTTSDVITVNLQFQSITNVLTGG